MERTCYSPDEPHPTTPAEAMNRDLTILADTLQEIAYDAGCALLAPVDTTTTRRYAARYNDVYRRLCTTAPCIITVASPLPEDATPGSIRIAARAAATYARETPVPRCTHRIVA